MGNSLHPVYSSRVGLDEGLQIELIGTRGNQESARGVLILISSLVHISCKSSLEQRILPPKKMENHKGSWSPRSSAGLAFSCDSFSTDHATVIQGCHSLNLSLWLLSNFSYHHFGFSVFLPVPQSLISYWDIWIYWTEHFFGVENVILPLSKKWRCFVRTNKRFHVVRKKLQNYFGKKAE